MVRQMTGEGHWKDHRITNDELLAKYQLPTMQVLVTQQRLRYAAQAYQEGPLYLHDLIHAEDQVHEASWLKQVEADLAWFNTLGNSRSDQPKKEAKDYIEEWKQPGYRLQYWKATLARAVKRHVQQETMALDTRKWRNKIFQALQETGVQAEPAFHTVFAQQAIGRGYECHCGQSYTTWRSLRLHHIHKHKEYAPERRFLQGSICRACQRDFWTTRRLQQHLAYIPAHGRGNRCYNELLRQGQDLPYELVKQPDHLEGISRLEAVEVAGAAGPTWRGKATDLQQQAEVLRHRVTQGGLLDPHDEDLIAKITVQLDQVATRWRPTLEATDYMANVEDAMIEDIVQALPEEATQQAAATTATWRWARRQLRIIGPATSGAEQWTAAVTYVYNNTLDAKAMEDYEKVLESLDELQDEEPVASSRPLCPTGQTDGARTAGHPRHLWRPPGVEREDRQHQTTGYMEGPTCTTMSYYA